MALPDERDYGVAIIITDRQARIQFVSDNFEKITGYRFGEAIGRNCRFLQGKDTDKLAVETLRTSVSQQKPCRVSLLNYRKDGVPFWNVLHISPMLNRNGEVSSFVGIQVCSRSPSYVDRFSPLFRWSSTPKHEGNLADEYKSDTFTPRCLEAPDDDESDEHANTHRDQKLSFVAETNLPTEHGVCRVRAYSDAATGLEPIVLLEGDVRGLHDVPLRVHDQCFTSEVLGSLKCDCRRQLDWSRDYIKENGCGIVIYLQQEGRGMGLAAKLKAYSLQERGFDTVDANVALGFSSDTREYGAVAEILLELGVRSVRLMTNNPRKMSCLRQLDVSVTDRIAINMPPNEHSEHYLNAKAHRMGHFI